MSILKTGGASTLDIIAEVKKRLPGIEDTLPQGVKLRYVADQSGFVRSSVTSVVREGLIAAALTGFMILVFLGSWRSTPDHHRVDPAGRAVLADDAVAARPDDQRDDARRPGARRRHPRRRCHRDDREHQPAHGGARRGHRHRPITKGAQEIMPPATIALFCILHRLRAAAGARRASPATCSGRWRKPSCSR